MIKAGEKVKVHIYSDNEHKNEIKTNNSGKIYQVYEKGGELCIDYDKDSSAWFHHPDGFRPLREFSQTTVVFEKC